MVDTLEPGTVTAPAEIPRPVSVVKRAPVLSDARDMVGFEEAFDDDEAYPARVRTAGARGFERAARPSARAAGASRASDACLF